MVAIGTAIALTVVTYYKWAATIARPKHRLTAQIAPICLVVVVMVLGALSPSPERSKSTATRGVNRIEIVEPVNKTDIIAQAETETVEPEPLYVYIEPEPIDTNGQFIVGTCGDLKARGLGPFYRNDANYTSSRDRDNDGIACENN